MNEAGAESWSAREPARAQRGAAHHVYATITDAQVDQVQGRAHVGGHRVRPDRVRGPIRRRRQAHAAG